MPLHALMSSAADHLSAALATPAGLIALVSAGVAAALIIASSFVKTMIPLRWLAVGSNFCFLLYGALHPSPVMVLLHGTLLPINLWRAAEMMKLARRVRASADSGDLSGVWLKPYMRARRYKAGRVLFRKGDAADHLYFLADGRIEFVEIGQTLQPGTIFGEIAFFSPDGCRTATARCATDCTVLRIDESTFRQLYYQNPAFGFEVVGLVAARLMADRQRLESQLQALRTAPSA